MHSWRDGKGSMTNGFVCWLLGDDLSTCAPSRAPWECRGLGFGIQSAYCVLLGTSAVLSSLILLQYSLALTGRQSPKTVTAFS